MASHVPFSTADVCWCQPFDGPKHPNCPMHGDSPAKARFANVGASVMRGQESIATCRSVTMAKRIAAALNWYKPGPRGS